jgi:peptidyl-prolyl cis-trans isomerase SurA
MKQLLTGILFSFFLTGLISTVPAQVKDDETLMTIAGRRVTVGEFMAIYKKNSPKDQAIDQASLNEYLDLFINFKLKVKEAEDLGLDTLQTFRTELSGYRDQLAKPYFTDEATMDRLVQEAFDRSREDVRASHIFVRVRPDAPPEDTLKAYQKIDSVRQLLMQGRAFEEVAVMLSEDPSARDRQATAQQPFIKGNKGDLGFFTVFDMVYPFETVAYTTNVGEISAPLRTEYGYHILKITRHQPALGKITAAHLYLTIPRGATASDSARIAQKIDSLYKVLKNGIPWDSLVRIASDDKGSSMKGGVLPKFGVNRMVPEFIEAIYTLKSPGDFSKPILTAYGWHIIRLVDQEKPGTFEEMNNDLKQKVSKDSRAQLSRDVVLKRIIKEYGLTEYPEAKEQYDQVVTDSIFFGKWNPDLAAGLKEPLFKIGNLTIHQPEFTKYLASKQRKREKENISSYVDKMYKEFLDESLIKWENAHLEQKYPEFKALMGEYRDGILLFDLTDQKVWSKAVKDTTGLQVFYEQNKNNYMWDTRVDASVFNLTDPSALVRIKNFVQTGLKAEDILKEINSDSSVIVTVVDEKFSRIDNPYVDKVEWVAGASGEFKAEDGSTMFVYIREVVAPHPKELNEARGLITADYQNYLEKEWIKELRKKYQVVVKKEVLAKIK